MFPQSNKCFYKHLRVTLIQSLQSCAVFKLFEMRIGDAHLLRVQVKSLLDIMSVLSSVA